METIANLLEQGWKWQRAGKREQAEQVARRVLELDPDNGQARHLLGVSLHARARLAEAVEQYEKVLRQHPAWTDVLNDLGTAQAMQSRLHEALATFERAVQADPQSVPAHGNVGNALRLLGRLPEAIAHFEEALRLKPDYVQGHCNLGLALLAQGRPGRAVDCLAQALALDPTQAPARTALQQTLARHPNYPEAQFSLGYALSRAGQLDEALAAYRQALRLAPAMAKAHVNVAFVLYQQGRVEEAIAAYRQALLHDPNDANAHYNLGSILAPQRRVNEAIACFRKAVDLRADLFPPMHLFLMRCPADYDPEATFAEHVRWGARFNPPPAPPPADRDPARRLRIGYVSGDFHEHVMGRYAEAVIRAHDRTRVEVFCYAQDAKPDALTERLMASADHWGPIVGLSDAQAADQVRADRIDLLIDLAGHTVGSRLGVFARKPAPIQITHMGCADTTGLAAIDYRLTDAHCDPPGRTEHLHTEKLVRLPHVHWCYEAPPAPAVGPLPALQTGKITFGSFNNLPKVTDAMIALWAQILERLPGSTMHLLTGAGPAVDEEIWAVFGRHGIERPRVTLLGRQSRQDYFRLYHAVDICLDTYPYAGCNTTADALWMGVPVVGLAGLTCVTRQCALIHVGADQLVTESPAAYVEATVGLALDLPRLQELRGQLRERVQRSPLMDVKGFTRNLEAAYQAMWRQFCT